ncbi:uncharacterized protein PV07_02018 [Cladophialophora immunda]|uniref:Uncharacterized protein n=1 Tax=Cladophialophora immunda TaxID=569365 RepID=A0A0D2A4P9_9EURO|nr:uncharacterized protein PV07_02018 [Cladophialophora immunda]KIW35316.1 hypothetical protein PV07_02018 [Cladophialophora immunda]
MPCFHMCASSAPIDTCQPSHSSLARSRLHASPAQTLRAPSMCLRSSKLMLLLLHAIDASVPHGRGKSLRVPRPACQAFGTMASQAHKLPRKTGGPWYDRWDAMTLALCPSLFLCS